NTVNCTATDTSGNTASCSFKVVEIDNQAPGCVCITNPPPGSIYPQGSTVTFTGQFCDLCSSNGHTATFTFTDASTMTTTTVQATVNEQNQTVSAQVVFQSAGVFDVTLTVCDSAGNCA